MAPFPVESQSDAPSRSLSVDVLRVIAILLVFALHLPKVNGEFIFGRWSQFGWIGADLFFVLSGYLIGSQIIKSLQRNSFSFAWFYTSRALRTLPAYLFVLGVYFHLPVVREKEDLPPAWRFLTFTQNFDLDSSAFSHAWSLCIEEQFYLLCPILLIFLWKIRHWAAPFSFVLVLVTGGFFVRHLAWEQFALSSTVSGRWDLYLKTIYYPTWGRLDGLVFGVGLAGAHCSNHLLWNVLKRLRFFVFLAGWLGLATAISLFSNHMSWVGTVFGYPLLALSFMLILSVAIQVQVRTIVVLSPIVNHLALLSYSFYLVHKMIIHVVSLFWTESRMESYPIAFAVSSLFASLLVSYFLYLLVERPFLDFRDRLQVRRVSTGR